MRKCLKIHMSYRSYRYYTIILVRSMDMISGINKYLLLGMGYKHKHGFL